MSSNVSVEKGRALGDEALDRSSCIADRAGSRLVAERHAFGPHDRDVLNPEEAEDRSQVSFLMVERSGRKAAARRHDNGFLADGKADWSTFGIAEGGTGHGEPVDPCLQLARHAEVVHRCSHHHDVGCEKVAERARSGRKVVLQVGVASDALRGKQGRGGEVADRRRGQVADSHLRARVLAAQGLDDLGREGAAHRRGPGDAGIDVEDFHHAFHSVPVYRLRNAARAKKPGKCWHFLSDYMMDFGITLDQLRTFTVVVEEGSFSAAARRMHRSQSAITYAIQKVEGAIGTALFDRSGYRPDLTQEGRALLVHARRVVETSASFERQA